MGYRLGAGSLGEGGGMENGQGVKHRLCLSLRDGQAWFIAGVGLPPVRLHDGIWFARTAQRTLGGYVVYQEMVKDGPFMRRADSGTRYHWCPGCKDMHPLPPKGWSFNGNAESPTFSPSFKHTLAGERVCHYVVTDGVLNYQGDCWHALAGQRVPMAPLDAVQAEEEL